MDLNVPCGISWGLIGGNSSQLQKSPLWDGLNSMGITVRFRCYLLWQLHMLWLLTCGNGCNVWGSHMACEGPNSPSCCIVILINIHNWPCLSMNNFKQMNQTRSLAWTSTLHDFVPMMHYVMPIADSKWPFRLLRVQPLVNKSRCFLW